MTKNSWLMITAICTLTGASLAAAQPGHGGRFEKFDTNGDGVVTSQEAEAAALAHFSEADANKDGKVTADERKAAHERKRDEHFSDRDANDNGVLERSEVPRMPEEFFTKLDTDKSGGLSQVEMQAFGPGHHKGKHGDKGMRGDSDGDGVVTKAEALAKAKEMLTKFDTNKDGKVTREEAQAFMASDGHGRCDKGEHGQGHGRGPGAATTKSL
ncbi:MAG: EF-hand domain-containing protein [Myxococcales bacterium]